MRQFVLVSVVLIGCLCQLVQGHLLDRFACLFKGPGHRFNRGCSVCICHSRFHGSCGPPACKPLTCHPKLHRKSGCCTTCAEGCYHNNFGHMQPGSKASSPDVCSTCSCSASSVLKCVKTICLPCAGHHVDDGSCCGRCDLHKCSVDGVAYENGENIPNSNPCETCHCVADGAHVDEICSIASCSVCEGEWTDDGTCCGQCELPTTCHVNGVEYDEGEDIPSDDPCQQCKCEKKGNIMARVCATTVCSKCLGITIDDGSCCGSCDTDVCEFEGEIYQPGVEIPSSDVCETPCQCEKNEDGEYERKCATVACPPCQPGFVHQSGDSQTCCGPCVPSNPDICATVKCAEPSCPPKMQHTPEGECCPECKCKYKKETYNPGPFGSKCDGCVCENGKVTCTKPSCPKIECVDPELGDDCCYHCPNGRTCLFGKKLNKKNIIQSGKLVKFGSNQCKCLEPQWYPNAFCSKTKVPSILTKSFNKQIAITNLLKSQ